MRRAGSGLATFGHPTSAGVPAEVVQHTTVLTYNDVAQLEAAGSQPPEFIYVAAGSMGTGEFIEVPDRKVPVMISALRGSSQ